MTDDPKNQNDLNLENRNNDMPGDFDNNSADFDDFESRGGNTLGDMVRTNPMVKVGAVAAGLVLILGGLVLFGGKSEKAPTSIVGSGSDVKEAPGTNEVSKIYKEAVEQTNEEAVEKAQREGGSAMPVPISTPKDPVALTESEAASEDPLARWRRIQEERTKREAAKKQAAPKENADPNAEAVKSLADAMSKQMDSILKNVAPKSPQTKQVTDAKSYFDEKKRVEKEEADEAKQKAKEAKDAASEDNGGEDGSDGQDDNGGKSENPSENILIPAGTIEYAQLLIEANSDTPGPVLAQIASGPLAGSRILGTFEAEDEYLVLTFNNVIVDGVSYPVDGLALDPKTATPSLVTDVDHRYFKRVILPAAAAFIEGMGSAIADSGSTNVTVNGDTVIEEKKDLDTEEEIYKGVEKAADKLGSILDREADQTSPLVVVAAGTPIGILFLESVVKDSGKQAQR